MLENTHKKRKWGRSQDRLEDYMTAISTGLYFLIPFMVMMSFGGGVLESFAGNVINLKIQPVSKSF